MGRRALRKIDPSLDLSRHLRSSDQLAAPLDPAQLFGRTGPLHIEVGSGKGMFLARAAAQFPQRNYLGIEVSRKYARFAAARLVKAQLANALVIHGDAQVVFARYLPQACAQAVYVFFPDPWWKKRHHKRRIMNPTFLARVYEVLAQGGAFHFWTDVETYFSEAVAWIRQQLPLDGPVADDPQLADGDAEYRTHYERRMLLQGQTVFRAVFRKP